MAIRKKGPLGGGKQQQQPTEEIKKIRINEEILASEVRLIDEEKNQIGIVNLKEALSMADERGVDLLEIVPNGKPPVCQLISYEKYLYQLKKREKEKIKKQKETQVKIKSMKLGVNTEAHDYNFKLNKIKEFIVEENSKVQIFIIFKGRQLIHKERGFKLLETMAEDLKEVADVESKPRLTGSKMMMTIAPKKAM